MCYDPDNPHRPGSPLNPFKGKKRGALAVTTTTAAVGAGAAGGVNAATARFGEGWDELSDLNSDNHASAMAGGDGTSATGITTSYGQLHRRSQKQVRHIMKHVRVISSDDHASSSADYSFHDQRNIVSGSSVSNSVNSPDGKGGGGSSQASSLTQGDSAYSALYVPAYVYVYVYVYAYISLCPCLYLSPH